MNTKKDIQDEISDIRSLKNLADVYGEIASIRMMKVRGYVLSNRDFIASITDIFGDTLAAYQKKQKILRRSLGVNGRKGNGTDSDNEKITFLSHNGKVVNVLISSNTGFYGEVVQSTFNKFLADLNTENFEITIIGRLGRQLFVSANPKTPYTYFDLPDYGMDKVKLAGIIKHLVQYEEIRIYYGKYVSVLKQEPSISKITAGTRIGESKEVVTDYIFEPSIEKILMFFEKEIFASFFDQAIRESQLAKFASRIFAMDRASQNIENRLTALKFEGLRLRHKEKDRKQINSLSSLFYQNI
jgi:ATP synthase F1 gamma subunit